MRKIFFIYLFAIIALPIIGQEAENDKRALEREIKTSGIYLYAEAVGKDKAEASKIAKTTLVSEINKEILKHPEWQFAKSIQADDIEYQTDLIDLPRGNKTRVIAYLKKDNIQVIFSEEAPKIKLNDKKEEKKKEEKETEQTKITVSEVVEEITPMNEENSVSPLLQSIIDATSASEINKILRDNKLIGKAMYGGANTLIDSSKAYILVYKPDGEIIALFDKEDSDDKTDLRSGEIKNMKQLFRGNLYIWFQLF